MAEQLPAAAQLQPMVLSERVELFIASGDLTYTDLFCVVNMKTKSDSDFVVIGETEVIGGNQNPTRWTKRFGIDYVFEEEQTLKFDVYSKTKKGKESKLVGTSSCFLGEILHEPGSILQKKLMVRGYPIRNRKNKRFAHVIVFAGKIKNGDCTRNLTLCFAANKLIQSDFASLSDPYFIVIRDSTVVYGDRRNHLKNTIYPKWKPFVIDTQRIANNDPHSEITIEIWDYDENDKNGDDFLGKVKITMEELKMRPKGLQIINPERGNKSNGTFDVLTYKSSSSFVDYVCGGIDMSMMCALDFTASNRHPSNRDSLHCIQDPNTQNIITSPYQSAIRMIGNILSIYDSDQLYPVWGFGLNVPSQGTNALHSFNLNFSEKPEVNGIHGIEQCYINAINAINTNSIILSGPTLFSPILRKAAFVAEEAHGEYLKHLNIKCAKYYILLMITDGNIDDMTKTMDEIVKISNTNIPLSVIIVGVGNEDFTKMEILDADDVPLKDSNGIAATRDIVQFVPFNKIAASNDLSLLAKETLAEIPQQFMSYVDAHNIEPLCKAKPKYTPSQYESKHDDNDPNYNTRRVQFEDEEKQKIDYNIAADPWLSAPVPPGWSREYTQGGKPYYVEDVTEKTQWEHPAALVFLKKIKEKEEAAKATSTQAQANFAFGDNTADWASFE